MASPSDVDQLKTSVGQLKTMNRITWGISVAVIGIMGVYIALAFQLKDDFSGLQISVTERIGEIETNTAVSARELTTVNLSLNDIKNDIREVRREGHETRIIVERTAASLGTPTHIDPKDKD